MSSQQINGENSENSNKRKREGTIEKSKKKIQLNIDNGVVSKEISTFICNEIVNKFKIKKCFEPTDQTPFFIIYSSARELMKMIPSLIETIYNMEISPNFKISNLIPIGFDAEYRKDWNISNIQISLFGICFVIQVDILKEVPKELIEFLQFKTIKLGVGVCNDIKHLINQKTNLKDVTVPNMVDLAIVASQYHLFGSSLVSLKSLALELLQMETLKNDRTNDGFVKYAAFDGFVSYASIYKLYQIMSSEDFEPWLQAQCKNSNDEVFEVNTTITNTSATNSGDSNASDSTGKTTANSETSNNLLKGKSFTSLKELAKLDPNATDKEREEFLNMRSTYMGMMYGDKTSVDQQISYAKEKNQARLRKMAHKNSTQRDINSLVDNMKHKKEESRPKQEESNKKQPEEQPTNSNNRKNKNSKKQTPKKSAKTEKKKIETSNISFQLV